VVKLNFVCKSVELYLFFEKFVVIVVFLLVIWRFIEVNHMERCKNSVSIDEETRASLKVLLSSLRIDVSGFNKTDAVEWMDRCVLDNFSVIARQAIVLVAFVFRTVVIVIRPVLRIISVW
jgi:hypothetical protein